MSAWSPDLRRSEARTEAGVNTTLVDQHQPVAFVLTGGAGHGAVQVGMLQALAAAGIVPDLLVGSSAGALNAVAYGSSPTPAGLQRLVDAWRGARRGDVFPLHPSDLLPAMLGRRDHLISPLGLRNWLATHLELDVLEHAVIPVHVVATDLATGRPVVISTGEAVTALMASSAVPSLFPPVALDGRLLVDGSVSADTPVTQASELGARTPTCCRPVPSAERRSRAQRRGSPSTPTSRSVPTGAVTRRRQGLAALCTSCRCLTYTGSARSTSRPPMTSSPLDGWRPRAG